MKTEVVISIGSNRHQVDNLCAARKALEALLEQPVFTVPVWTVPIGIVSDNFLNSMVKGLTTLSTRLGMMAIPIEGESSI